MYYEDEDKKPFIHPDSDEEKKKPFKWLDSDDEDKKKPFPKLEDEEEEEKPFSRGRQGRNHHQQQPLQRRQQQQRQRQRYQTLPASSTSAGPSRSPFTSNTNTNNNNNNNSHTTTNTSLLQPRPISPSAQERDRKKLASLTRRDYPPNYRPKIHKHSHRSSRREVTPPPPRVPPAWSLLPKRGPILCTEEDMLDDNESGKYTYRDRKTPFPNTPPPVMSIENGFTPEAWRNDYYYETRNRRRGQVSSSSRDNRVQTGISTASTSRIKEEENSTSMGRSSLDRVVGSSNTSSLISKSKGMGYKVKKEDPGY